MAHETNETITDYETDKEYVFRHLPTLEFANQIAASAQPEMIWHLVACRVISFRDIVQPFFDDPACFEETVTATVAAGLSDYVSVRALMDRLRTEAIARSMWHVELVVDTTELNILLYMGQVPGSSVGGVGSTPRDDGKHNAWCQLRPDVQCWHRPLHAQP